MLTNAITVRTNFETSVALALIGAHGIQTRSIVADVGRPCAFVQVDAGGAVSRQNIARVTNTLEAALEIVAHSMLAHTFLLTFVDVCGDENINTVMKRTAVSLYE